MLLDLVHLITQLIAVIVIPYCIFLRRNQDDVDALRAQNQKDIADLRKQCETHVDPMIENIKRELKLQIDSKAQKELVVNEIKRRQRECEEEIRKC